MAIDAPGHGRSDYKDTTEVYFHRSAAGYIIGLLEQLHIDSAYVMGMSSGSLITLYLATLKRLLTQKIIIISVGLYFSETSRKFITSLGPLANDQEALLSKSKLHGTRKAALLFNQFWNFRKLYGDPSFTPDVLATIKAKTLIIHGDADPIASVSNAWEMYHHISKANLWIVPNGGYVPIDNPTDKNDFLTRALDFLSEDWNNNK
ncbi:MAG: alpha/beta hydrolase [Chitinophagaceae bacterium]